MPTQRWHRELTSAHFALYPSANRRYSSPERHRGLEKGFRVHMATVFSRSRRMGRFALALFTVVAASAACADAAPSAGAPSSPLSASAVVPSDIASPRPDLVVGGDRPVSVHLPASFDANETAPLLILLHGYSGSGEGDAAEFKLAPAAAAGGLASAYPDGTVDSQGNRFWNATDATCDFDETGVDDLGYLTGVIDEIQAELDIDPKRIYVFGHSCGGFMAYRLACDEAGVVAAIVSVAGATYADPADCAPSAPVSVVQVLMDGRRHRPLRRRRPPGLGSVRSGSPVPGRGNDGGDLGGIRRLRRGLDAAGREGRCRRGDQQAHPAWPRHRWRSGRGARRAAVQLWTIPDGGHMPTVWSSFADTVLGFLLDHPKP